MLVVFAGGCGASPPNIVDHWKRTELDTCLIVVERDEKLVAEIHESDMRGGYGSTGYPVEREGEKALITLPFTGRFTIRHDEEAETLDIAGERYERVSGAEAEAAFERFAETNEAIAGSKALCSELQDELTERKSERTEGDREAWNAYLDERAMAKLQDCTLVGDGKEAGPFGSDRREAKLGPSTR